MIPRAGDLRDVVTILVRSAPALDAFGQEVAQYITGRTFWAIVRDLAGEELIRAQQIVATATTEVVARWNDVSGADPLRVDDRLLFGAATFGVSAIVRPAGPRDLARVLCARAAT